MDEMGDTDEKDGLTKINGLSCTTQLKKTKKTIEMNGKNDMDKMNETNGKRILDARKK